MTPPKECKGCLSFKSRCMSYIGYTNKFHWKIFKDQFCPCKQCLVKVTCKDPKYMYAQVMYRKDITKCKMFRQAVEDFKKYVKEKGLRTTRIKIRR